MLAMWVKRACCFRIAKASGVGSARRCLARSRAYLELIDQRARHVYGSGCHQSVIAPMVNTWCPNMLYAFRHPDCAKLLPTQTDHAERTPRLPAVIRCLRPANFDACRQPFHETFPNVVGRDMPNNSGRLPSLRSGRHLIHICVSVLSYVLRWWPLRWRTLMAEALNACARTECNARVHAQLVRV